MHPTFPKSLIFATATGLPDRFQKMMAGTDYTPAYHASVSDDDTTAELHLYDVIGKDFFGGGIDANDVVAFLDAHAGVTTINMRINTPGGSVFEGMTIYNKLRDHVAKVNVIIDGLCASIGTVIAMAGDTIEMADNGTFMIHNPWGCCCGGAEELEKTAAMLNTLTQNMLNTYTARTGADEEHIRSLMDAETWMTAEEAKELGFVDSVKPLKQRAAAFVGRPLFAALVEDAPEAFKKSLAAMQAVAPEGDTPKAKADPATPTPPVAKTDEQPVDPRAECKRYIESFGAEKGAAWFAEGKPFADCQTQHARDLTAENAKLSAQLNQIAHPDGEAPPVDADLTDHVKGDTPGEEPFDDSPTTTFAKSLKYAE